MSEQSKANKQSVRSEEDNTDQRPEEGVVEEENAKERKRDKMRQGDDIVGKEADKKKTKRERENVTPGFYYLIEIVHNAVSCDFIYYVWVLYQLQIVRVGSVVLFFRNCSS